jgi:voltage-gated potassium channel
MKQKIAKAIHYHFHNPNYAILLASLFLMIILPPVSTLHTGLIVLKVSFGFVILIACIYTAISYRDLIFLLAIGTLEFVLFLRYTENHQSSIFTPIVTLVFFTYVFVRIIKYVFQDRAISANDIFALSCGYLILGIIATPFFYFISMNYPDAFQMSIQPSFNEFLYFSYITLTAVGYGDVTPVHPIAKSFAVVLGIVGQLYLTVLVGIIIGKYLSNNN